MAPRTVVLYNPMTDPMARPNAPLALLALARMLPRERYLPVIVNAAAERRPHRRVLEALGGDAVLLGISAMTGHQIRDALRLARRVRRRFPRLPIVWGGYHPSLLPQETLADAAVDYVVTGQGERPFAELVERLASGEAAPRIPGVFAGPWELGAGGVTTASGVTAAGGIAATNGLTAAEGRTVTTGMMPAGGMAETAAPAIHRAEPLDAFPPLPWDLIDLATLRPVPGFGPAADFYTSQGCPYACGFCAEEAVHGRRRLALSPLRAADDVLRLASLGIRAVQLRDTLFFVDPRWIEEFCRELLRRNAPLSFHGANGRVDGLLALSPAHWDLIEAAGFRELFVGVESGHPPALARIDKRIRPEQTLELVERVRERGIRLSLSALVGVPGVDPEAELRDTLALLREALRLGGARISSVFLFVYAPYPGSRLFRDAVQAGFQPPCTLEAWGRIDFHGTGYPWGSRAARRRAVLIHRYILPRLLHSEPSRIPAVEALCRLLDPRVARRWEEERFGRFWERTVYDGLNGLRAARRRLR